MFELISLLLILILSWIWNREFFQFSNLFNITAEVNKRLIWVSIIHYLSLVCIIISYSIASTSFMTSHSLLIIGCVEYWKNTKKFLFKKTSSWCLKLLFSSFVHYFLHFFWRQCLFGNFLSLERLWRCFSRKKSLDKRSQEVDDWSISEEESLRRIKTFLCW